MKHFALRLVYLTIIVVVAALDTSLAAAAEEVDYVRDVRPIFHQHCIRCHGPNDQESDLRLDTAKGALTGGISGPAIVASKPDESLVLEAVLGTGDASQMPPEDEGKPLTKDQIAVIRKWIASGAKHPADEKALKSTEVQEKHWAFEPVAHPPLPKVASATWPTTGIDFFTLARLEAAGLAPSKEADPTTLVRRLHLDLLGVPPTPEEVQAFVADKRPGAYERMVDRLLASPQYGERWGRHWLDQARYADSDGYTNDAPRTMWIYRDWVINAFNANQPFDEFIIEQFAGDLLPKSTTWQQIATGFHRNTQINREGGSDAEQYRVEAVVDRVNTTGAVLLGLTLGCARCHDHKYDPIGQREYYQLFAFLNNQDEPTINVNLPEASQAIKTKTYVLRERSRPRVTKVMIRGDFLRPGREVVADVPAVLPPLFVATTGNEDATVSTSSKAKRTRMDLARWLIRKDNPLTPRVTMNRLWQQYFGVGIVETENDFGLQGTPPSHPELLDWLAWQFVESGWDLKQMHRLIVTSATYRQASLHREDVNRIDPRNRLLGRQNRLRLEAEAIRDSALHASGMLSKKLKGPSVYPPQPDGVMRMTRNPNRAWRVSRGEDRYRRGMYTYFWRSTPHPFLRLFNAPESNTSCTRRDRSNTPLQALTLLNDTAFVEAAAALGKTMMLRPQTGKTPQHRLDTRALEWGFERCLLRKPDPTELRVLHDVLEAERSEPAMAKLSAEARELAAWTTVARVLLNLDEFITRE